MPILKLLGCYHQLQVQPCSNGFANDSRLYKDTLVELFPGLSIVGEEAGDMENTIAKAMAEAFHCQYHNLDIPRSVKEHIEYVPEGQQVPNDDGTGIVIANNWPQYRKAWGLVREFHMFKTFLDLLKGQDGLLICGIDHICGLKALFEETYNDVRPIVPPYQGLRWW